MPYLSLKNAFDFHGCLINSCDYKFYNQISFLLPHYVVQTNMNFKSMKDPLRVTIQMEATVL